MSPLFVAQLWAARAADRAAEHLACADDIRKLMRTARYKKAARGE